MGPKRRGECPSAARGVQLTVQFQMQKGCETHLQASHPWRIYARIYVSLVNVACLKTDTPFRLRGRPSSSTPRSTCPPTTDHHRPAPQAPRDSSPPVKTGCAPLHAGFQESVSHNLALNFSGGHEITLGQSAGGVRGRLRASTYGAARRSTNRPVPGRATGDGPGTLIPLAGHLQYQGRYLG